jgi:hypothetical protein
VTFLEFTSPVVKELTDKEEIKKIEKKSAQLLPAQYFEPVTPERSPPKKQVWRKKDQSTPSEELLLPALPTEQTPSPSATSSTPLVEIIEGTILGTTFRRGVIDDARHVNKYLNARREETRYLSAYLIFAFSFSLFTSLHLHQKINK